MSTPLGLPFTAFPCVDSFTIASIPMPGKWTLLDAKKKFGWQIQQGYGLSGAFVFPKGDELIVPKFKGEFWDQADVAIYKQVRVRLLQKGVFLLAGNVLAAAMGIDHPELKALGVEQVVVLEVSPLIQTAPGLWTVSIDFLQYRKPLPAPPKPKTVIPDIAPPVPVAKNARQVEAQKLAAEIAALKGG